MYASLCVCVRAYVCARACVCACSWKPEVTGVTGGCELLHVGGGNQTHVL